MLEKNFVVGPFQCNCRLLACPNTGEAILVDAGDEAEKILSGLRGLKTPSGLPIKIKYLLHTHGHLDHIGATRSVYESLTQSLAQDLIQDLKGTEKPIIALHKGDEPLYQSLKIQGNLFGIQYEDPLAVQHYLKDQETLNIGQLKMTVIHTPGHSPGSVCFHLHSDSSVQAPEVVFSGDTLFQGSVGRTDLWGGDQAQMFKSIKQRLLVLDGDTRVSPGHGDDTKIGIEKLKNPFLN